MATHYRHPSFNRILHVERVSTTCHHAAFVRPRDDDDGVDRIASDGSLRRNNRTRSVNAPSYDLIFCLFVIVSLQLS